MRALRRALPVLSLLLLSSLSGCFQSFTLIRVNRDGSGTLEERFLLANRFADMLRSMGDSAEAEEGQGGEAQARPDPQAVDLERLRARAAGMGQGVELELAEPAASDTGAGYRAVFGFADINTLELRFDPAAGLAEASGEQSSSPEPIRFRFTPGQPAELEILLPSTQASEPEAGGEPDEGTLHMLRQVYGDMRIRLAVEVDGQVAGSDAAFREGSTVTLLDLDFGRLMQDEQALRRIAAARPSGLQELKDLADGNPALRIETGRSVHVRFR